VRQASSGEEALEEVRRARPDIIFLDIRMPGLGGVETLQRLQQEGGAASPRVVAVTASVLEHERGHYLEAGFDAFLGKPLRREQICACLAELLGVEFEYRAPTAEHAAPTGAPVVLPAPLLARLREAIAEQNATLLQEYLDELEGLGEREQNLAAPLRALLRDYDMDAMLEILGERDHE
jgi:CheY-like chemotaxis protein